MEMRFSRKCSDSESKISEYQTRLQVYIGHSISIGRSLDICM